MEQQIKELNAFVKTRIAPSKVHGVGVFALRDIEEGETLYADMFYKVYDLAYENFDKLRPEVKEILLERWPQIVNGSKFIYPDTRIQAFMNHSDDPNYDAVNDITLKAIGKDEEITEDYRKINGYEKIFSWLCK